MAGTTTTTETESIALSSLRIKAGHRPVPRESEDVEVTQPEPAVIKTKSYVPETDATSQRESHHDGSSRSGNALKVKQRGHVQFAALCFCLFLAGYNDGMVSVCYSSSSPRPYIVFQ